MADPLIRRSPNLKFSVEGSRDVIRYLVEDESSGRFIRLGRREYLIATMADGDQSVSELLKRVVSAAPEEDWSSQYADQCLKWLISNRVLEFTKSSIPAPDSSSKKTQPPPQTKPFDIFSFRFSVISGDVIHRYLGWLTRLSGPVCLVFAVGLIALAAYCGFQNYDELKHLTSKLFVPDSKYWWLFAWLILKTVHEVGHAAFALAAGGAVRQAGVSFFCFTPIPYVDVSDIWRSPRRRDRIMCSMGGVLAELVLSAVALILCCWVEIPAIQYACISIVTLGTISTIAFNANPLMRYDGYYVVSDLLHRPALWQDATNAWQSRLGSLVYRGPTNISGHLGLAAYGIGTLVYRFLMLFGLAWGAITVWEGVGWLAVGLAFYSWFIVPASMKKKKAALSPAMERPKVSPLKLAALAIAILSGLFLASKLHSPIQRLAPGVVVYADSVEVRPQANGIVREFLVLDGQSVEANQPIAKLENLNLEQEYRQKAIELAIERERIMQLNAEKKIPEMQASQSHLESLRQQFEILERQVGALTVTSPKKGRFMSSRAGRIIGDFVTQETVLGLVTSGSALQVEVSISQQDIERYRSAMRDEQANTSVFVASKTLVGTLRRIDPKASDQLSHLSMAAMYGGPLTVRQVSSSDHGDLMRADQSRFIGYIDVPANSEASQVLQPGQNCVCWPSTTPESLLTQLIAWSSRAFWSLTKTPV